ncbi:hypothetical protein CTI12_AA136310 [Artemisia annua]|uniref:Uncharacterized protein n=1 Tax=Artemisia annua TaxID=35608 RepID=A0A2U1PMZ5_ARTAN|nr:hypothetical protein CTI12_AA136310 [Artemisia annua]
MATHDARWLTLILMKLSDEFELNTGAKPDWTGDWRVKEVAGRFQVSACLRSIGLEPDRKTGAKQIDEGLCLRLVKIFVKHFE